MVDIAPDSELLRGLRQHVELAEIPHTHELLSGADLQARFDTLHEAPLSLIGVGDVMLGGRATPVIAERGTDHLFAATAPLLRRAGILLGNLEGPLARKAAKEDRNYSYRVRPDLAAALARAGFKVMTLANNHLLDCGREGVLETLQALSAVGIAAIGAGVDRHAAHAPAILRSGEMRIGLLGYYWNRRTSATGKHPGSAMDPPESLQADIAGLREQVDRVVVTFHWGVPYEREPSPADRDKARFAAECGADAVIGHHTHVVQPFEVHHGCPIFYGVGNFAFGSGNSRAEGLAIGVRFEAERTQVEVYPLYVKNRDPRANYQPKVMCGAAASRVFARLAEQSGAARSLLRCEDFRARFEVPAARRPQYPAPIERASE
jgi:poly-gamma-glutamate capsule biosynthesis protein CapA/YwtB (metallophosphatase superfamily)